MDWDAAGHDVYERLAHGQATRQHTALLVAGEGRDDRGWCRTLRSGTPIRIAGRDLRAISIAGRDLRVFSIAGRDLRVFSIAGRNLRVFSIVGWDLRVPPPPL